MTADDRQEEVKLALWGKNHHLGSDFVEHLAQWGPGPDFPC